MDGIYEAMRETVGIKEGDRFQTITEHQESEFSYGANFLDISRTDDLVQIQIFWSPGKSAEMKLAMYEGIVRRLGKDPGVRAEDVFICIFEAPAENWSFGGGKAQFYHP
jgi:4-oxalocrotonate tautomerase